MTSDPYEMVVQYLFREQHDCALTTSHTCVRVYDKLYRGHANTVEAVHGHVSVEWGYVVGGSAHSPCV